MVFFPAFQETLATQLTKVWTSLLLKLFVSPNLQKRLFAIKGFVDWAKHIETMTASDGHSNMDDSGRENGDNEAISAEELQEARNEEFIDFLCNQRVIDVLFEHLHQQCFIQSRELFVYLGEMRKRGHRHALPDATLRVLWKRCVAAPDYLASEMCTLLVKTFPSLPPSAVSTLLKHITAELLHQGPNVENAVVARRRTIVLLGSMHAEVRFVSGVCSFLCCLGATAVKFRLLPIFLIGGVFSRVGCVLQLRAHVRQRSVPKRMVTTVRNLRCQRP